MFVAENFNRFDGACLALETRSFTPSLIIEAGAALAAESYQLLYCLHSGEIF
jgi:hypothetical protein